MFSLRLFKRTRLFLWALLAVAGTACSETTGPGDGNPPPSAGTVDRVVVDPGALLLVAAGETMQLQALAYDAGGALIQADVTWQSNAPGVVSVSADGVATASGGPGSAQIMAVAQGVYSAPALAIVASPAPLVVLIPDAQIVSDPVGLDPPELYGPGWLYRIRVKDVAVAPGQLVIGTGGRALAGRVTNSSPIGSETELTVEVVPLNELFVDLHIDVEIPLVEMEEEPSGVRRAPMDGAARFDAGFESGMTDFTLGRFKCKAEGGLPEIDLPSPTWNLNPGLALAFGYHNGMDKYAVVGSIDVDFAYKPVFEATFTGKVGCETVLSTLTIPLNGFLSYFVGIQVPLGIGFEFDAKLEIAEVGFDVSAELQASAELGLLCPPAGGSCSGMTQFDAQRDFDFELIAPDPLDSDLRLELGAHGFLFAKPSIGSRFSSALQFEFLSASAGLKQSIDLMTVNGQVSDNAYASEFKLAGLVKVGAGKDVTDALDKLGNLLGTDLDLDLTLVDVDETLAESPKGTFTITPGTVEPGDDLALGELATFTIDLDPITYLGIESVEKVEILWKIQDPDGAEGDWLMAPGRPSCTEIVASAGQTKFECQTDFLEEHAGKQTFYAFVHAKLFGLPVPVPFEISEDATAVVNVGDPLLEFRFETDLEGWETGTTTDGWGTAQWRSWCGSGLPSGCVKLDGTGGDGVANAWIFKTFDLPDAVTTLQLETTAHNRDGADSEYRIRIVDAGGVETILADWTASSGAEDQYFWAPLSYDISSFAGQQVTVYLEGGDNGPGTHEQRYYDNVVIR